MYSNMASEIAIPANSRFRDSLSWFSRIGFRRPAVSGQFPPLVLFRVPLPPSKLSGHCGDLNERQSTMRHLSAAAELARRVLCMRILKGRTNL